MIIMYAMQYCSMNLYSFIILVFSFFLFKINAVAYIFESPLAFHRKIPLRIAHVIS